MSEKEGKDLLIHRAKLLAIIGILLLPFIAGWLAFYVFEYRPDSQHYGELVQPAKPLQFPELENIRGKILEGEFWQKWTYVLLDNDGCKSLCRDNLYYLRQMRTALGRDMDRVQNLFITRQPLSEELSVFLRDYPKMNAVSDAGEDIFELFDLPGYKPGEVPMLYLIDPAGNLMMTYPAVNDASSILSDIRRLLKLSQIG
jgi:cytochrome oxidase Cu insertion factor (SCO1/SenC/PrrC family)